MSDGEWTVVKNTKGERRRARKRAEYLEEQKWEDLLAEIPHIITPDRARGIEARNRVRGVVRKFQTDDWIDHQLEGWRFFKILRSGEEPPQTTEDDAFSVLSLDNGYGDAVLFRFATVHRRGEYYNDEYYDDEYYDDKQILLPLGK